MPPVYAQDDGACGFALAEEVARYHLLTWQEQLVAFLVHEEGLALPGLIDFGADDFALAVLVLVVEGVVLQLHDAACQCLAQLQDGAASELRHVNALADFFAYLIVVFYLLCFAQGYFLVLVGHFSVRHDDAVVVDFEVTLVGVDDDVVVLVGAVHLGDDAAEAFFEHTYQRRPVDVVLFLEVGENLNHVYRLF